MTAAFATHSIRLTFRFHVGDYYKEADLALPATSSIGELLGEVMDLLSVPSLTKTWKVTTVGGRAIDMTTPLHQTGLQEASILILRPEEPTPAPVIRDAAEALAHDATEAHLGQLPTWWSIAGMAGLIVLACAFLPPVGAVAAATFACLLLALWRSHAAYTCLFLLGCTVSGWLAVGPTLDDVPLATAASISCLVTGTVALHLTQRSTPRITATALTLVALTIPAAPGFFLPGPGTQDFPGIAAAALTLATLVILLATAPGLSTRLAGLKVPQLPTAGQDLAVSDSTQPDVDDRARRAGCIYDGICLGMAAVGSAAVFLLALTGTADPGSPLATLVGTAHAGTGFAFALIVALTGAVILHAGRQGRAYASIALMCLAMACCLALCLLAALTWSSTSDPGFGTWAMALIAFAILAAIISLPLWARFIPQWEPTTIVWCERLEALAIAACLPLSAHLAGIFLLIRGLG